MAIASAPPLAKSAASNFANMQSERTITVHSIDVFPIRALVGSARRMALGAMPSLRHFWSGSRTPRVVLAGRGLGKFSATGQHPQGARHRRCRCRPPERFQSCRSSRRAGCLVGESFGLHFARWAGSGLRARSQRHRHGVPGSDVARGGGSICSFIGLTEPSAQSRSGGARTKRWRLIWTTRPRDRVPVSIDP